MLGANSNLLCAITETKSKLSSFEESKVSVHSEESLFEDDDLHAKKNEMTVTDRVLGGIQTIFNKEVIKDFVFGDMLFRRNSSLSIEF